MSVKAVLAWVSFPAVNREINGNKMPWMTGWRAISRSARLSAGRNYGTACRLFGNKAVDKAVALGGGVLRYNAAGENVTAGSGSATGDSDLLEEQVGYIA